ncbi:MAG: mechanosensitive ion channel [Pseudomonadota bacterium]|nr:mechanosensitive ion channel [Pseudomonadota bacterium]
MSMAASAGEVIARLDAIGFDVGTYHISLYRTLLIVVTLVAIFAFGRLAESFAGRIFGRMHRLDPAQQLLGQKLFTISAWIILALAGIEFLGVSLTALTVFSGAFGLAIGFGLQKTFGNLISGIILLMDRSIKPGDVIAVGTGADKMVGQVSKIGIRAVSVVTRDKIEFLIPNETLMTSTVENWSYSSHDVRVKVPVPVAYGSDLVLAEKLLLEAAMELPRVLKRSEPQVWLNSFGDNAILFEVQMWIEDPEDGMGNLRSDLLKSIWQKFQVSGVEIPFPQTDIRIKEWPSQPAADSPES